MRRTPALWDCSGAKMHQGKRFESSVVVKVPFGHLSYGA